MRRTIPLVITASVGFVLIVSQFIPATENWGEVAAVWFDVLASIAFILGGGNLLKVHLKKISDRAVGWGYSGVTILAFVITLGVGLWKVGARPAPDQEYFGETFARLPLDSFPESQVARVGGALPRKPDREPTPPSVRRQLNAADGELVFRGWMLPNQKQDLLGYQDELEWQCTVEKLADAAQPPDELKGRIDYYADHRALAFRGVMSDEDRAALRALSDDDAWQAAVESIAERSRRETRMPYRSLPDGFETPGPLEERLVIDESASELVLTGSLSASHRAALADQFPVAKPLRGPRREAFLLSLESAGGALSETQRNAFDKTLDGAWTVPQLRTALDAAGAPLEVDKTACEMLAERESGVEVIEPTKTVGETVTLNDEQIAALEEFANDDDMTAEALVVELKERGPFEDRQAAALDAFLATTPTVGERNRALVFALLWEGPLSGGQRDRLLDDFRAQHAWERTVGALFVAAHDEKYPWSGNYREQGSPFWWIYEYAFKPLTATMFAMLAFYVASAAFRAFRAKNFEAILLLGTAFIILLGRTFAGVVMTGWLPEGSEFRIENLTVTIMQVFNTAGNRAIMIGIALGIASTSLKVLLGIDRSYLGSSED